MINITARTGDLELIESAVVTFDRVQGLSIKIGNINAKFEVTEPTNEKASVTREALKDQLTLLYKVTGKLPSGPFTFGLLRPEHIGMTDNVPIYFWWRMTSTSSEQDVIDLSYSVYSKRPENPS